MDNQDPRTVNLNNTWCCSRLWLWVHAEGRRSNTLCGFTWHPEGVEQEKGDRDVACMKRRTAHTRQSRGQHSVASFRNTKQGGKKRTRGEKIREREEKVCCNGTSKFMKSWMKESDSKRRPRCSELLHNELLECIEFIEWAAQMGMYR